MRTDRGPRSCRAARTAHAPSCAAGTASDTDATDVPRVERRVRLQPRRRLGSATPIDRCGAFLSAARASMSPHTPVLSDGAAPPRPPTCVSAPLRGLALVDAGTPRWRRRALAAKTAVKLAAEKAREKEEAAAAAEAGAVADAHLLQDALDAFEGEAHAAIVELCDARTHALVGGAHAAYRDAMLAAVARLSEAGGRNIVARKAVVAMSTGLVDITALMAESMTDALEGTVASAANFEEALFRTMEFAHVFAGGLEAQGNFDDARAVIAEASEYYNADKETLVDMQAHDAGLRKALKEVAVMKTRADEALEKAEKELAEVEAAAEEEKRETLWEEAWESEL